MNMQRLYLDIHVLQNTPPSCINRDDTGSPKTAIYGGVTRARVSSQAWKRAIRMDFRQTLTEEQLGERTKRIIPMVAGKIALLAPQADSMSLARQVLEGAEIGLKAKDSKKKDDKKANEDVDLQGTGALFFLSHGQAKALARLAVLEPDKIKQKDAIREALDSSPSVDMALFGRMVADAPSLNVDAACQVAHAISTHAVRNEFDYFTAVDDLAPKENAGAGHIGTKEFNASVLYRYATVAVHDLTKMLGEEEALRASLAFTDAFVRSMPTGNENSYANRTLPDVVYIAVRRDQPVNLVGAFERPVIGGNSGLLEPSVAALREYATNLYEKYDMPPAAELDLGGEITGHTAGGLKAMLTALGSLLAKDRGVTQ